MSKFEISPTTTKLCMPGSMSGTVHDKRAGGKKYKFYAGIESRKVSMIFEITGGDPAMPNTRCVDQKSVARIRREIEATLAV